MLWWHDETTVSYRQLRAKLAAQAKQGLVHPVFFGSAITGAGVDSTRGEGVLECAFGRYQPVRGTIPTRPRSDLDPLSREEYLLHIARRVAGR